jgi:hypothetical protein
MVVAKMVLLLLVAVRWQCPHCLHCFVVLLVVPLPLFNVPLMGQTGRWMSQMPVTN